MHFRITMRGKAMSTFPLPKLRDRLSENERVRKREIKEGKGKGREEAKRYRKKDLKGINKSPKPSKKNFTLNFKNHPNCPDSLPSRHLDSPEEVILAFWFSEYSSHSQNTL